MLQGTGRQTPDREGCKEGKYRKRRENGETQGRRGHFRGLAVKLCPLSSSRQNTDITHYVVLKTFHYMNLYMGERNPPTLLVAMQIDATMMENSMQAP